MQGLPYQFYGVNTSKKSANVPFSTFARCFSFYKPPTYANNLEWWTANCFFFSEHIRRASTLLTQHHGYQVPFRPGFSPKRVLHTKNDAAKKKIRTETFQTGCLSQKENNRHGIHEKTNQRTGEQLPTIFMWSLMAFSCNGLYSNSVMFCFYKHNVAFVPGYKGIDELKETRLHDQCYF